MTSSAPSDPFEASAVGGRTLEAFADTPRLNAWLYGKLAPHIHGDVLEIGSGIGNMTALIAGSATSMVATDMEAHYLEALRARFAGDARIEVAHYDLDGAPPAAVSRRRFDAIVAVNVIEHIRDDRALVQTLSGLLKPGGKLVVYVPACPAAFGPLDQALGHYRRYTPGGLGALLEGAGLLPDAPQYMNVVGLVGWVVSGRVLRRRQLSAWQIATFERLLPIVRLEDRFRLPIGLGVYTAAEKPVIH
jgi:SAM-dependent methyltransferase